jgi:hypothetical protein
MAKRIDQITRTLSDYVGGERQYGYDPATGGNFKNTSMSEIEEYTATDFKNYLIDGDFYFWNRSTSGSSAGYISDVWAFNPGSGTGSFSRQYYISSFVKKYFARLQMTSGANNQSFFTSLRDVTLVADKNINVFMRVKSSSGVSALTMQLIYYDGTTQNTVLTTTHRTISNADTWEWVSFNITTPDLSAYTIGAGNYTKFRFFNNNSETFILDIDKVRVVDDTDNFVSGDVPEWVNNDEDPEKIRYLVEQYYVKITGKSTNPDPLVWGRGAAGIRAHFSVRLRTQMIQTPAITINAGNSAYVNATTGAVTTLTGSQTISNIVTRKLNTYFVLNDNNFVTNNIYGIILRNDLGDYLELDATY